MQVSGRPCLWIAVAEAGLATCRVLGVAADADARDIKAAYRAAALQEHPDVSAAPDAEQRFKELTAAYGASRSIT